jgi:hypothetical protein
MHAYVQRHLGVISAEVLRWDSTNAPAGNTHFGVACEQLANALRSPDPHAAAYTIESYVREQCLARVAAPYSQGLMQTLSSVVDPRAWRVRLLTLNFWLQMVGASMGLAGQFLINQRNAAGFVCWIVSNVALIVLQSRTRLMVLFLLHGIYLCLSVQGLYLWLHG